MIKKYVVRKNKEIQQIKNCMYHINHHVRDIRSSIIQNCVIKRVPWSRTYKISKVWSFISHYI